MAAYCCAIWAANCSVGTMQLVVKLRMLLFAAIIGRLGTAPLGAVGLSTLIFVFSNLFFNFLTVCTTSTVATAAAEKDTAEVRLFMVSDWTELAHLVMCIEHAVPLLDDDCRCQRPLREACLWG